MESFEKRSIFNNSISAYLHDNTYNRFSKSVDAVSEAKFSTNGNDMSDEDEIEEDFQVYFFFYKLVFKVRSN